MSQSAGVEELYRNFGILADAGENVSEVRERKGAYTCKTPAHNIPLHFSPPHVTPPVPLSSTPSTPLPMRVSSRQPKAHWEKRN